MKPADVILRIWAGSTALALWSCSAYAQATPASAQATSSGPIVELVKAFAWPIAAVALGALFYKPLSAFLGGIGNRITKLSVFKVEFELLPGATATSVPLFDEIRGATSAAEINDSTQGLLAQLASETPADFATVYLGDGQEWITSRLFIGAVMIKRMRGAKALVFLERGPNGARRFVAVSLIDELIDRLVERYPWFEAAWGKALSGQAEPRMMMVAPHLRKPLGGFTGQGAQQVVRDFIETLQQDYPPVLPAANPSEWTTLKTTLNTFTYERACYVTTELIRGLLPACAFTASMDVQVDTPRAKRSRALLRRPGDFVALLGPAEEFRSLTNRRALLEELSSTLAEEPE